MVAERRKSSEFIIAAANYQTICWQGLSMRWSSRVFILQGMVLSISGCGCFIDVNGVQKEFGTFPKVLLAMGASYVQAVTELSRINARGPHNFDYTVVDDGEALVEYRDAVAVNVSWLKKCLVTGIEGPIPWPDHESSRS